VEFEGTLENARLKGCLCGMEKGLTCQEGEDYEASRSNAYIQKYQALCAQSVQCQKVLLN